MKSFIANVVLLVLFCFNTTEIKAATSLTRICYYQPIYSGWVILSRTQYWECGWGEPNAYWIGIPDPSGESICANSPMPVGWVITGRGISSACGTNAGSTSYIKIPAAVEDICEFSPVPANYTVISRNIAMIGCEGQSSMFAGKRILRK